MIARGWRFARGWRLARAVLMVSMSSGCLASPPPASLAEPPDAGSPASCSPGELVTGSPFNASPILPEDACWVENVRERDGMVAGLDRSGSLEEDCATWGDPVHGACGCVGLDLGAVYPVSRFIVRAQPTAKGCGTACSDCGTGHTFSAWTGTERGEYGGATEVTMTGDSLQDYVVEADAELRFAVVCRDLWGEARDDVAVDSIEVVCR